MARRKEYLRIRLDRVYELIALLEVQQRSLEADGIRFLLRITKHSIDETAIRQYRDAMTQDGD